MRVVFQCGRMNVSMPRIIAGILGLTALAISIFAGHDPVSCIVRGAVAFAAGLFFGSIWESLTKTFWSRGEVQEPQSEERADSVDEAA